MNLEKDQELSVAKLRIEELEALVASKQKEVRSYRTWLIEVIGIGNGMIVTVCVTSNLNALSTLP